MALRSGATKCCPLLLQAFRREQKGEKITMVKERRKDQELYPGFSVNQYQNENFIVQEKEQKESS